MAILLFLIFFSYIYVILKSNFFVIPIYLTINLVIFVLPGFLYFYFGAVHPSNSYTYLKYGVEYYDKYIIDIYKFILIFDLILLTTYYFLNKCRLQIPHIFYLKIDNTQLLNNSSKIFFTLLPLCFFFDFLNIFNNNIFMNKSIAECSEFINKFNFEISYDISKFSQVIKSLSTLKYYSFALFLLISKEFNCIKNKIYSTVFFIICLLYGILTAGKFDILLPLLIILTINIKVIFKIKNFIIYSFGSYLLLFFFPIIGTLRNSMHKLYNSEECKKYESIIESTVSNIKYNNIHLIEDSKFTKAMESEGILKILIKPLEIILSRLNYLDPFLKTYVHKIKNNIANDITFYNDNIIGLIPRFIYKDKPKIVSHSDILAVDLGLMDKPYNAVGFRPIAEAFYYIGHWEFLIVASFYGLSFYIMQRLYRSGSILLSLLSIYTGLLILKRDSFHAIIPSIAHEVFAYFILIISIYLIIKIKFKNK